MKPLRWRSVTGGAVALATIVAIIIIVLVYARTGMLHGDKFRLYVAVPDASDVIPGTDVWLNGRRVGTVADIGFAPPSTPKEVRVIIAVDVLASMRQHIRLDSHAALRSGGTIIGAPVVSIEDGSLALRAVVPGDTLRGAGQSDFEIAASRVTESFEELPAIAADAKTILANARASGARLSSVMQRADNGSLSRFMTSFNSRRGGGSAGRLMRDTDLRARIAASMAASDSLRMLLATRTESMGRFRRDSTLPRSIATLQADVATLRQMSRSTDGTIGRLAQDSALYRGLDSVFLELNALLADVKKHPLRYARVF